MNNFELIFLLEERSMEETLNALLPRIIPLGITYKCIPHEGKQDLEKSIPRKLKAWHQSAKFIVIRDKDSADCLEAKQKLLELCQKGDRPDTLIRIVCHELESWFLGDLAAVEKGLQLKAGKFSKLQNNQKYRNPDNIAAAKQELQKIAPDYQPIRGSRAIAPHLNLQSNTSKSFQIFLEGVNKIITEIKTNLN
ncbi:MAG: hypothetical protein RLZZ04_3079 [Cyanobacteriota bacterium]|jgi:hypothetical protein